MNETAHTRITPRPWFVAGTRVKLGGQDWHAISRYDEATKQDENVALVGYDPRTGLGFADAHFFVRAVNAHDDMLAALKEANAFILAPAEDIKERVLSDLRAAISKATAPTA